MLCYSNGTDNKQQMEDSHTDPTHMLEVFPLNQIDDVGAPRSEDPRLMIREIIFEVFPLV